jgi:hypothetical protein
MALEFGEPLVAETAGTSQFLYVYDICRRYKRREGEKRCGRLWFKVGIRSVSSVVQPSISTSRRSCLFEVGGRPQEGDS